METMLDLPAQVDESLDEIAERTGLSRLELIRNAVLDFVERNGRADDPGWPRSIGTGGASEPRADAIDDWLAAHWKLDEDRNAS